MSDLVEPAPELVVLSPLQHVEAELGFTFGGDGESANAAEVAALVCTQPTCPNRGNHLAVHADTPLPVHCGGCSAVLLCDHDMVDTLTHEGVVSAPVEVRSRVCSRCGFTADVQKRTLPGLDLASLPITALPALG